MKLEDGIIVSHQRVAENIYELVLKGDFGLAAWFPGQFVQVKVPSTSGYLRRPFSIVDAQEDRIVLVYRIEGQGTRALSELQSGEIVNVLGPLGNTFPQVKNQRIALVGGGIGVVPLLGLGRLLKENGNEVHSFMGFTNQAAMIYTNTFSELGPLSVATVDGSYGVQGNVFDILKEQTFDVIYACGPTGMLQAINEKYIGKNVYISLEARMACGYGVCNACVCKKAKNPLETALICRQGPVFLVGEVEV